jgi:hypothetical protein
VPPVCPFEDARGHWSEAFICDAFALGLVQGDSKARFAPDRQVTRLEMALMLERLVDVDEGQAAGAIERFADASAISEWARGYVGIAATQGWLEGRANDRFEPPANATRAGAVTTILRLWKTLHP